MSRVKYLMTKLMRPVVINFNSVLTYGNLATGLFTKPSFNSVILANNNLLLLLYDQKTCKEYQHNFLSKLLI